jgi:hypothetical protein
MKLFTVTLVFLLVNSPGVLYAQERQRETTLAIGGFEVWIGMRQQDALTQLATLYDIRSSTNMAGDFVVYRKGGPPFVSVGRVTFAGGKLLSASRVWSVEAATERAFASALADALDAAVRLSGRPCVLNIDDVRDLPGLGRSRNITMRCGRRMVSFSAPMDLDWSPGINEAIE